MSVADAFQELFYGSGSWLGLMLYMTIILCMMAVNRKAGVFFIPVTIVLGINYLENSLGWHSLIMWGTTVMILFVVMKGD